MHIGVEPKKLSTEILPPSLEILQLRPSGFLIKASYDEQTRSAECVRRAVGRIASKAQLSDLLLLTPMSIHMSSSNYQTRCCQADTTLPMV